MSPFFEKTTEYLFNDRISSGFKYDALYYSLKLITIYHPKEYLIMLLFALGILFYTKKSNIYAKALSLTLVALIFVRIKNTLQDVTLLFSSVALGIGLFVKELTSNKRKISTETFILIWFLFAFICYGLLFTKPLTHIYTFMVPLFVLAASGFDSLIKKKCLISFLVILIVGISSVSYNYQAFIDSTIEYPWNPKSYLFGKMYGGISNGENVSGVFGFPYNRNLSEIRSEVLNLDVESYKSNEKYRITKYYIRGIKWRDADNEIYIWIDDPQSLSNDKRPAKEPIISGNNYEIYKGPSR